jgi:3-dehydroquinate synthase
MLQLNSIKQETENTDRGVIEQKISIPADYSVYFTHDVFSLDNPVLQSEIIRQSPEPVAIAFFIDSEVLAAHPDLPHKISRYAEQYPLLKLLSPPISVQGGEACKNDPAALLDFYKTVIDLTIDRHNCIIVIGGGAVLDFVGYAAATAHRGIRLIRLPTTVLSQNDSGVGVKNGINFQDRKNFLGTFSAPDAVICDVDFLFTLSPRDRRAGMAEAIKVSLIRDGKFFNWLEQNVSALVAFEVDALSFSIRRSAEIHARQISGGGDPFEKGSARPLDYGHWLAHKLESMSGYAVRHGEAVAIGMLVDARYSFELGLFPEPALIRVQQLLKNLGFELWHSALELAENSGQLTVMSGLEEFREHLGGKLSITLLSEIGRGIEVHEIDHDLMLRSLKWVQEQHA